MVQVNHMTLQKLITYYRRANNQKAEKMQMSYQTWHLLFEKNASVMVFSMTSMISRGICRLFAQ